MKFAVFTLVAALGTGVAFFKSPTNLFSTPTSTESMSIPTHSINGNVVDERLADASKPVEKSNKKITKVNADKSRVLYLDSEVSFLSSQSTANSIKALNAKSSEPIWLLIDSPGGSVLDGATVTAAIQASKAPVYTVCTRLCASMAAMIHSYGAKRYSTDGAILMYHPASSGAQGQVPNMVSQLATFTRYLDKMVSNVVGRSHISKDQYDRLVAYELWVDAEDSETKGLIDGIVDLNVPYFPEDELKGFGGLGETITIQPDPQHKFQYISPYLDLWNRR